VYVSVDTVNVTAAYQPVVLACAHCGGRRVGFSKRILTLRMHGANKKNKKLFIILKYSGFTYNVLENLSGGLICCM
jgi:hypothetical protein